MTQYRVNLAAFGTDSKYLATAEKFGLEITKKGEIWNRRTGTRFDENIIRLLNHTTYEDGFEPAIEEIILKMEESPQLMGMFQNSPKVELQIRIEQSDDDGLVPSIHMTARQLGFLSKIGAEVDVDIN